MLDTAVASIQKNLALGRFTAINTCMIQYYRVTDSTAWPAIETYALDPASHVCIVTAVTETETQRTVAVGDLVAANTHYNSAFLAQFASCVTLVESGE